VVITGTFPELGGGSGLNLGKEKAEEIITIFGGRVIHGPVSKIDAMHTKQVLDSS